MPKYTPEGAAWFASLPSLSLFLASFVEENTADVKNDFKEIFISSKSLNIPGNARADFRFCYFVELFNNCTLNF